MGLLLHLSSFPGNRDQGHFLLQTLGILYPLGHYPCSLSETLTGPIAWQKGGKLPLRAHQNFPESSGTVE